MKAVTERAGWKRRVVLALVLLSMVLATLGSVAVAAPAEATKSSSVQLTVYDPFRCVRTPVASDVSITTTVVESAVVPVVARPVIRVPVRPPLRSAFHPVY